MNQPNTIQPDRLALIGMDLAWTGGEGLEAFERAVFEGARPQKEIDAGARLQQTEARLASVAMRAMQAAGSAPRKLSVLQVGGPDLRNSGLNLSQETTWLNLSGEANPLAAALEKAQALLAQGQEAVLVVMEARAGDQPGASLPDVPTGMGFDRDVHGWWPGAASGALLLMPYGRAVREGRHIDAVILGLASTAGKGAADPAAGGLIPPVLEDVRASCRAALEQAGATPSEVGYLEMFACGQDGVDGAEIAGVCQTYRPAAPDLTCAFGSVQANLGFLGAAGGFFGLLRAALCLSERLLPVVPGWNAPKLPALWRNAPFYAPAQSSAWFARTDGRGRLAAVNAVGLNGSFAHLVLGEPAGGQSTTAGAANRALQNGGFLLFPLSGHDLPGLLAELEQLRSGLAAAADLPALAAEWHASEQPDRPYAVSIVGHTQDELLREVELALRALPAAFEKGAEWQTPLGSCFSGSPVGSLGQVAFVYPGAFNSYPWVGKDLFRLFPWLHQRSLARTVDMGKVLFQRELYPRSLTAPSKDEQAAQEARLLANPVAMLTSGSSLAILFTYVLQEGFNLQPAASFGYSLGENSMLFASQVWQEGDAAATALQNSPLFHNRLAGPQNAIREAWGLPQAEQPGDETLWNNYLVMAPLDAVRAQVEHEPRVYITHVNTPRQVVIGGDPAACQRILAALRSPSIQAPFDYALHCAAMASEKGALTELHDLPLENVPATRLYTAANYQPMQLEPLADRHGVIAEQIAHMLCSPLDFPRLVRQVYADGARVFIEVGAGGNCARWISESLKGEAHLALSVNRRGTDDYHSLVRLLAKLHSHRVPLDLSPLFRPVIVADRA